MYTEGNLYACTDNPWWHPKRHPDLFGVVLAAFVFSQIASLATFRLDFPHLNILGLFGYCTAYGWLFIFGPVCPSAWLPGWFELAVAAP